MYKEIQLFGLLDIHKTFMIHKTKEIYNYTALWSFSYHIKVYNTLLQSLMLLLKVIAWLI